MKSTAYRGIGNGRHAYRGVHQKKKRVTTITLLCFLLLLSAAGLALISMALSAAGNGKGHPDAGLTGPDAVDPAESADEIVPPSVIVDSTPLIVVDAGHGGRDSGAQAEELSEKTLNLAIAQRVKIMLEEQGFRVLMIRDDDTFVDKERRAEIANEAGASLFISIHQNADDSGAHGIETWYDDTNPDKDSHRLAQLVQESIVASTGARDRGLRPGGNLVVLTKTAMPACLIETGFITSSEERERLKSAEYQEKIARGIAQGVHQYIKPDEPAPKYKEPPTATTDSVKSSGWGLSFQENGQPPVANLSLEELAKENAAYLGDTNQKRLYLTFDAGYENGYTASVLDTLKRHEVPAAFFVVGHYIQSSPELVRRMYEEGHIVGNHTANHPDMTALTELADFQKELWAVESMYQEVTGQGLPQYYRPPEGKYSEHSLRQADYLGYRTVFWSLAYVDWEQNQPTKQQAFDKLLPRVHSGAVILLHSTSRTNAEILDELLTLWKAEGYTFGTLGELFEGEANYGEGDPAAGNDKTLYLTFDDGPSAKYTETVLDELKARDVKATFFLVGENVRKNPELARRIADEGHTIGIHCYSHKYKDIYASVDSYVADFTKAFELIYETTGVKPVLFRFPGGSINAYNKKVYRAIIEEMTSRGYIYFDWNAGLEDAVKNPDAAVLLENAQNSARGKQSVVMLAHDTVSATAEILPELLDMFSEYKIEPLTPDVAPVQFRYD